MPIEEKQIRAKLASSIPISTKDNSIMTTVDKIKEIEAEMARTQKNKVH